VGRRLGWWAAPLVGALCGAFGAGAPATALAAAELTGMRLEATSLRLELSQAATPTIASVRRSDGSLARVYVDLGAATQVAAGVPRQRDGHGTLAAARLGRGENGELRVAVEVTEGAGYELRREAGGRVLRLQVEPRAARAKSSTRAATAGAAADAAKPDDGEHDAAADEDDEPADTASADAEDDEPPTARSGAEPVDVESALRPRLKVVLDPGHGGSDPGATGYATEKFVTLAIAVRLGELIRQRLDADVVLTRTDDRTLELSDRTAIANAERADLFVSIHANASPREAASGIETYLLDDTSDRATLRLAAMENGTPVAKPQKGETDLTYILSDLVQGGKGEESHALARAIQRGLVGHMRRRYTDVVDLGVKRGPFYVLVGAHMPCVLVETAFLTNPTEGRRLAEPAFQDEVAEGIYGGIAGFLADAARSRTL